jgi:hypothetical protein
MKQFLTHKTLDSMLDSMIDRMLGSTLILDEVFGNGCQVVDVTGTECQDLSKRMCMLKLKKMY